MPIPLFPASYSSFFGPRLLLFRLSRFPFDRIHTGAADGAVVVWVFGSVGFHVRDVTTYLPSYLYAYVCVTK